MQKTGAGRFRMPTTGPGHNVTVETLATEHFADGSIGPKVAAACNFARSTGHTAIIGALDDIADVIAGKAGTRIRRQEATGFLLDHGTFSVPRATTYRSG